MRYFISILCLFGSWYVNIPVTEAAVVNILGTFDTLKVGEVVSFDVVVDTERQVLNAAEVEIIFPAELLEYQTSDEGDSILNFWIQKPVLGEGNQLRFSGITPGGFTGEDSALLTLTFKVIGVGQGNIEVGRASLLLHDGLGTAAVVTEQNLHIAVSAGAGEEVTNVVDDERPEPFTPEIIQDQDVYDGDHVLIYATEDKGTGIDYFAVKEGWLGAYLKADSPYHIKHQSLDRKISVKAVDKLGNERVEVIYPQNWQPWYERSRLIIGILILCALSLYTVWRLLRRRLVK